jgi:hypothetical protein
VHADQRQVLPGRKDLLRRPQQLDADEHRVQAADEEEEADADQVLDADDLVVGAQPEVARDALRLLLAQRRRIAAQPSPGIDAEAEPDQEADDAEEVTEKDRDVVLAGVGEVRGTNRGSNRRRRGSLR